MRRLKWIRIRLRRSEDLRLAIALIVATVLYFLCWMGVSMGAEIVPSFGNVPWGSQPTYVIKALTEHGFTFDGVDPDGDLDFNGTINGHKVFVFEFLGPKKTLIKTEVCFLTNNDEALPAYTMLKGTLEQKFGAPSQHYEDWLDPYTESDSELAHETALSEGKGKFGSFWEIGGGYVYVEITKKLTVIVNYESTEWKHEDDRRESAEQA